MSGNGRCDSGSGTSAVTVEQQQPTVLVETYDPNLAKVSDLGWAWTHTSDHYDWMDAHTVVGMELA